MPSKTVFVGGIGGLSPDVLGRYFSKFGNVRGVAPKQGFAFVTFDSIPAANKASDENFHIIGSRQVSSTLIFEILTLVHF